MSAIYLLDTNICIYILDDAGSTAAERLGRCMPGEAVTSVISYAEVIGGRAFRSPQERTGARRLFEVVPVLPFDQRAAQSYSGLPFKRGSYDRLIAGHALSLGLTLVTNNERDFATIAGLRIENWARP